MAVLAIIDDKMRKMVRWEKELFEKMVEFGGWKVCFLFCFCFLLRVRCDRNGQRTDCLWVSVTTLTHSHRRLLLLMGMVIREIGLEVGCARPLGQVHNSRGVKKGVPRSQMNKKKIR